MVSLSQETETHLLIVFLTELGKKEYIEPLRILYYFQRTHKIYSGYRGAGLYFTVVNAYYLRLNAG